MQGGRYTLFRRHGSRHCASDQLPMTRPAVREMMTMRGTAQMSASCARGEHETEAGTIGLAE